MESFEPLFQAIRPDWLVVVGDVNSTLACALVAAKLREQTGSRIAHVEAGLRSNDWRMPEEVNRVLTDRLADLLLTPSHDALRNLIAEGIPQNQIVFVGNVMIDTLMIQLPKARARSVPNKLGLETGRYVVATLHRPSNVDSPDVLRETLNGLACISATMQVVLPIHPRTLKNARAFGLASLLERLMILDPLGYVDMLSLTDGCAVVLTDSGGLQEESTVLGVPCVTLREQTERPITITEGTNRLVSWPLTSEGIVSAFTTASRDKRVKIGSRVPDGWDGNAANRIVQALGK
jgi:UDP-N-acetylglucosamine 2-epimerase (non-hydrolysing)